MPGVVLAPKYTQPRILGFRLVRSGRNILRMATSTHTAVEHAQEIALSSKALPAFLQGAGRQEIPHTEDSARMRTPGEFVSY